MYHVISFESALGNLPFPARLLEMFGAVLSLTLFLWLGAHRVAVGAMIATGTLTIASRLLFRSPRPVVEMRGKTNSAKRMILSLRHLPRLLPGALLTAAIVACWSCGNAPSSGGFVEQESGELQYRTVPADSSSVQRAPIQRDNWSQRTSWNSTPSSRGWNTRSVHLNQGAQTLHVRAKRSFVSD